MHGALSMALYRTACARRSDGSDDVFGLVAATQGSQVAGRKRLRPEGKPGDAGLPQGFVYADGRLASAAQTHRDEPEAQA